MSKAKINRIGTQQNAAIKVSHLRIIDPRHKNGIVTQGTFNCVEDIRKRVIERGLGEVGSFVVEQEINGKWVFQILIEIKESDYKKAD